MAMTPPPPTLGFVIRDAHPGDIPGCLAIDHRYRTELVWQMSIFQEGGSWQITFRTERLPRVLEALHTPDERRLRLALTPGNACLVAVERPTPGYAAPPTPPVMPDADGADNAAYDEYDDHSPDAALPDEPAPPPAVPALPTVFGYLTLRYDPARRTAWVQDLVVDADLRRGRIGSRLLNAARRWAAEQGAARLMVEITTRNYPAIAFCTANGLTFCGYNDHYLDDHDIAVFFGGDL